MVATSLAWPMIYYLDPDGNSVELQSDNLGGDWVRSSAFLRMPAFARDPVGKQIDPEQMLVARARGADADEIHQRGYAGELEPGERLDFRIP